MAIFYPELEKIKSVTVKPEAGELYLLEFLKYLDDCQPDGHTWYFIASICILCNIFSKLCNTFRNRFNYL